VSAAACRIAGVLGVLLLAPGARAQESDDCLPLQPASADRLAERLDLSDEQTLWLLARLLEERLREPEDLDGLPDAGAELREAVAASFCWGIPWRGGVLLAGRRSGSSAREEGRIDWERGGASLQGRWQRRAGEDDLARAALTLAPLRGWRWTAGCLEGRHGFGLAMAFPGSRGGVVRRRLAGSWRASWSADPSLPWGLAVRREGRRWRAETFAARFPEGDRGAGVAVIGSSGGDGSAGVLVAGRADGPVAACFVEGRAAGGAWGAEWARSRAGSAWGASWRYGRGAWRADASVVRRGPGFDSPFSETLDSGGSSDEAVETAVEVRRRSERGRFLRVRVLDLRRPDPGWAVARRTVEAEVGDRLAPGVDLVLLGRVQLDSETGRTPARASTTRGEIRLPAGATRLRLRAEERVAEGGSARLLAIHLEGGRAWRWEVRAAAIRLEPGADALSWYRRRAGGLYGWDRPGNGTALGAWTRAPLSTWQVEASVDGGPRGWEATLAMSARWGT
jgi:hypothetical protein